MPWCFEPKPAMPAGTAGQNGYVDCVIILWPVNFFFEARFELIYFLGSK
jgi:hypothetical protein